MLIALNEDIAGRLDEVSRILAEQQANHFRVHAYQQAATMPWGLSCSVSEVFAKERNRRTGEDPGGWVKLLRARSGISFCTENWPCCSGDGANAIPLHCFDQCPASAR